jgi:hypothetical protein
MPRKSTRPVVGVAVTAREVADTHPAWAVYTSPDHVDLPTQ